METSPLIIHPAEAGVCLRIEVEEVQTKGTKSLMLSPSPKTLRLEGSPSDRMEIELQGMAKAFQTCCTWQVLQAMVMLTSQSHIQFLRVKSIHRWQSMSTDSNILLILTQFLSTCKEQLMNNNYNNMLRKEQHLHSIGQSHPIKPRSPSTHKQPCENIVWNNHQPKEIRDFGTLLMMPISEQNSHKLVQETCVAGVTGKIVA